MINFKLAFRNALKHKGSSLVLTIIISLVVFALFWIFGFSNTFTSTTSERELFYNGHLSYQTDFISGSMMKELIVDENPETWKKLKGREE